MSTPAVPTFASIGFHHVKGVQRILAAPTPAVQTDWSLRLPTGSWWRLLCGRATLVTDSNAANRTTSITLDDGTVTIAKFAASAQMIASSTYGVTYTQQITNLGSGLNGTELVIPLFSMPLQGNFNVKAVSSSLQAGDQWSAINFLVEEIDMGPYGERLGTFPRQFIGEIDEYSSGVNQPPSESDPLPRVYG